MKRFGIFILGTTPMIISLIMSTGMAIAISGGISAGIAILGKPSDLPHYADLIMSTDFATLIMLIYTFYSIILFGCWYYSRLHGNLRPDPVTAFHPYQTLGVALLVPGAQVAASLVVMIFYSFSPAAVDTYEELMDTAGLSGPSSVLMFFYVVLLGPLSEELIFRGVTLKTYQRILPFWAANLMQALLFGIFHMNLVQGSYAFALGLLLGYVCHRGKTIYLSIFMHILFNFWGTYASLLFGLLPESGYADLAVLAIGLLSLFSGIRLFRTGTRRKEERMERIRGIRNRCIRLYHI